MIGPRSQAKTFRTVDGRGVISRKLRKIESDFSDALGGWQSLTPQKRQLIRDTAQIVVRREMVWHRMVENPDAVSGEAERRWLWLANTVRRNLQVLGLERKAEAPPTLDEYLRGSAA